MIKVGIIGGAGYTAGELIRLLVNHPEVEISWVNSESNVGNRLADVHQGLEGDTEMLFTDAPALDEVDVIFLCSGHGASVKYLDGKQLPANLKIIDLSQDFRDESAGFVYGLPEVNRERIKNTNRLANPGCFATALQLATLPAVTAGVVDGEIHVTALTGSTGAGVKPGSTTHFSWRTDNISTYKEFTHQHLIEIGRTLKLSSPKGEDVVVNFVPMRGDFARGIFASVTFDTDVTEEELVKIYEDFFKEEPFTHVIKRPLDLKQVVNTNKALVHVEKHGRKTLITAAIDNLLKGASGQAVQNMNIMYGLDEKTGLRLKASAF